MRIAIFIAIIFISSVCYATDFYNVKAKSAHCATPEPIANKEVYPLAKTGCAIVLTVWGLLEPPTEVQPGVMKVNMGGVFGIRYVESSAIIKE